ncbi:alpha/beta fold hydrolase [Actinokineospora auranticolor]|uniref:alpha/beta fold hydrolase n=1 Tax=Actinokineospora auranticolor TaxID=155976 RepID=UPI001FE3EA04|nr:alpha/beta fold hydrolase [Actinokineospora auranticolor]
MSVTHPAASLATAVILPGTGSDEVFVRNVFSGPLRAAGLELLAPAPEPGKRLVEGYVAALDEACGNGPVVVGGVSLGAHVAALWAARHPDRCSGLLLALPAWTGEPGAAPASVLARASAADVRARGVAAVVADVPGWLGDELRRSWRRYGDALADSLDAGAAAPGPSAQELSGIQVPVGIGCCVDDPVHPDEVARQWVDAVPLGCLRTTRLAVMAVDPEALGRAAVGAFLTATARRG